MRAIDTNVLIRLVMRDEARQSAAADRFVERGAWVPLLALAETTWVLGAVYERNAADIAMTVDMLLSHKELTLQEPETVAAALELFRANPATGFFDCLLLATARKAGHHPLGTFDRRLAALDGAERI
jgi:predicted nucleic-acid-binding protein